MKELSLRTVEIGYNPEPEVWSKRSVKTLRCQRSVVGGDGVTDYGVHVAWCNSRRTSWTGVPDIYTTRTNFMTGVRKGRVRPYGGKWIYTWVVIQKRRGPLTGSLWEWEHGPRLRGDSMKKSWYLTGVVSGYKDVRLTDEWSVIGVYCRFTSRVISYVGFRSFQSYRSGTYLFTSLFVHWHGSKFLHKRY